MRRIKQMADEPIGNLVELREMRKGGGLHLLRGHTCVHEVRRTFST